MLFFFFFFFSSRRRHTRFKCDWSSDVCSSDLKQPSRYADLAYGVTTNYDPYTSELPTYSMSEMTMTGHMVGPRGIDSGFVAYGRAGKPDSAYVPIESLADAQAFMARKRALGGTIVKSYRQPMRSQRQELIEAGREAGIM